MPSQLYPSSDSHHDSMMMMEQRNHQEYIGEPAMDSREPGEERTADTSLMAIFRDFFLAAFSDHYQEAYCCGAGFMQASHCCSGSKARVAPAGGLDHAEVLKTGGSSTTSSYNGLPRSVSQDSKKRAKRPLAVAAGYNYANDMNGRPVVITPGNRKIPIDLVKASSRSSRSRSQRQHSPLTLTTVTGDSSSCEPRQQQVQAAA